VKRELQSADGERATVAWKKSVRQRVVFACRVAAPAPVMAFLDGKSCAPVAATGRSEIDSAGSFQKRMPLEKRKSAGGSRRDQEVVVALRNIRAELKLDREEGSGGLLPSDARAARNDPGETAGRLSGSQFCRNFASVPRQQFDAKTGAVPLNGAV